MPPKNQQTSSNDYNQMSKEELMRKYMEMSDLMEEKEEFIENEKRRLSEENPEMEDVWQALEDEDTEDLASAPPVKDPNKAEQITAAEQSLGGDLRYIKDESARPYVPPAAERQKTEDQGRPSPEKPDDSAQTRKEIEELRRKLGILEAKTEKSEESPQKYQEKEMVSSPPNLPTENIARPERKTQTPNTAPEASERYGVAPARDLGTGDFEWQGNVGGVEIERSSEEDEEEESVLDRAQVLEDIEHPPAYTPTSSLEEKLQSEVPLSTESGTKPPPPLEEKSPEEIEKARQVKYRGEDPYRESIE